MNLEVVNKVFLGIALAAPIGPVSIEMIYQGLRSGFMSAFIVRLGAAVGNLLCLSVSYYGISQLSSHSFFMIIPSTLASLILIHRSYIYISNKGKSFNFNNRNRSNKNKVLIGLYLSIANPIAFVFWSGIVANTSESLDYSISSTILIITGVLIWGVFFSALVSLGKHYVTPFFLLSINKISGMCMLYYGIKFLWRNLTIFIF